MRPLRDNVDTAPRLDQIFPATLRFLSGRKSWICCRSNQQFDTSRTARGCDAPPGDLHLHELDIACTTAADGPNLPGNLWTLARECLAGPSTAQTQRLTDTQSALRRFPQHRTQGFATDLECKCIRGAKIPHAVCANTTRVSPRKGQLLRECAKNAQLGTSLAPGDPQPL